MVTTREQLREAEERAATLQQLATEAKNRAAELRRQGVIDEPEIDGMVVRFTLRMRHSGTRFADYQYAAIRAGGKWFTTGATCPRDGYRWERLWSWINDHELVGEFEVARFGDEALPF